MPVSIVKTENPKDVRQVLEMLGGMERFVKRGDRVLIKPNICAPRTSQSGAVTDPELVAELCRLAADCGGKVSVGDSPIFPFPAKAVFRVAGYSDFSKRYGFPMFDLDSEPEVNVRIPGSAVLDNTALTKRALETDVIINVPVMKNHVQTGVTLALKNMKGVVPRRNKHQVHIKGLDGGIVDINSVVRTSLVVVDAITGMEGMMAPINGKPKQMNLLMAGDNIVEADATACRIMGIDPTTIKHILEAEKRGLGHLDGAEIIGESIQAVRSPFKFYNKPRNLTAKAGRVAWKMWNRGYNELTKKFGSDVLKPLNPGGEWLLDNKQCNLCKLCIEGCPVDVLHLKNKKIIRDKAGCIYCYCCVEVCPKGAISRR